MGVIKKQAIAGSVYTYMGVALGFVTTGLIMPHVLETEQVGLLRILNTYALLFAQFATLGFTSVISRLFTYFRDFKKQHNGFFFLILLVIGLGFLLTLALFFAFKPLIISRNIASSPLFIDYLYYVLPLVLFTFIFSLIDTYYTVLYNAVKGIFLKEFLQRLLILFSISLYYFNLLNFRQFILFYLLAYAIPTLIIVLSLIFDKQFFLRPQFTFLNKKLLANMSTVSLFGLFGGFSGIAVLQIDSMMIASMISLKKTGVYAVTFFIGTLVVIAARTLRKISTTFYADAWKQSDLQLINKLYFKNSINQFAIGMLFFIGIWANIDNALEILPLKYTAGRYVVFFIALANLIEMLSGGNNVIISTSKSYKMLTYFLFVLIFLMIWINYLLIPRWGITGAAAASAISALAFNAMRYLFLLLKYKFQPLGVKHLFVVFAGAAAYSASLLLPVFQNFIVDLIIRSGIITVIYVSLIFVLDVSDELRWKAKNKH